MISSQKDTSQPWAGFWHNKHISNERLLKAIERGRKDEVQRMLNPHEPVDSQPELRYTNKDGLGAVHLAVIRDRFDILKILLKTDQTLLCMPTENDDQSYIIHQAVSNNNPTIIRYLLGNPAYFRLFKEQKESSKNHNLGANNQR